MLRQRSAGRWAIFLALSGCAQGETGLETADTSLPSTHCGPAHVGRWQEAGLLPDYRCRNTRAVLHREAIYVVGGPSETGEKDEVWRGRVVDGATVEWEHETPLPAPVLDHGLVLAGDYLLTMGGRGASPTASWVSRIGPDGHVGTWEEYESVPLTEEQQYLLYPALAFSNGHLVVAAGAVRLGANEDVWAAPLGDEGRLGSWAQGEPLPSPMYSGTLLAKEDTLVFTAGELNEYSSDYYQLFVAEVVDGVPRDWVEDNAPPRGCVVGATNGRDIYTLNCQLQSDEGPGTSYAIGFGGTWGDDGSWVRLPDLPVQARYPALVATETHLFVVGGGFQGFDSCNRIVYALPLCEEG